MIACFIRYEIDVWRRAQFERLCPHLGHAIPAASADMIGYFAPHEGSTSTAYGVYNVASLADYEAYRARLAASELGRENYA